ncbi:MAG TPA: hypothetical protein VMK12_18520 [Anaeromyxobacteraceae bacterium]|nr:hypothetical protein [Anaeromyxobacteraceae bacterium]
MAKHHVELGNPGEDVLRGIAIGAPVGLGLYLVGRAIGGESSAPDKAAEAAGRLDAVRGRAGARAGGPAVIERATVDCQRR